MDATTSSTSSPRQHAPSRRELPHTLSIINNVQNAIAAIEQRLEHNPSAQPPPPQRNEYPAQHGNNRDKIYSATVKHLEQPIVHPQHNSASNLTAPTVDADAVLSPQSTFSSLAIDEAVSVTSDYQVSTTFGSPVPRLSVSTTRSIADIVQHFESNTAPNPLSRDTSSTKHSSPSIAPIVDRFESEQRLSDASRPATSIAPIVEQFQRSSNSKSSVSFAHATDTFTTASKENTPALDDDVDLSSVGATVDPSEFELIADEADRISQRALSVVSLSKSERDVQKGATSSLPPSNASDPSVPPVKSNAADDEFEGSTVQVDALSKSLHVDADDLEVTDESVAHAIKTLDTYSIAAGVQTAKDEQTQPEGEPASAEERSETITSAHGADITRSDENSKGDISAPIDDSFSEEQKSDRGADMAHASVQVSEIVDRAQPSVPRPLAEKSNIPGVESNSRSFTITSTTISSKVENDGSRLERVSVIETFETTSTHQIRDSENSTPAYATGEYSTLNPSPLQEVAEDQNALTTSNSTDIASVPITSTSKDRMAATDSSVSAFVSPADIGSVANVSTVRKAQTYDELSPGEPVVAVSVRQTASSTAEDVREHVEDDSNAAHELVEKVAKNDANGVSDSASETISTPPSASVRQGAGDVSRSTMAPKPLSTRTDAAAEEVGDTPAQEDISPVDVQDLRVDSEVKKEAEESLLETASAANADVPLASEQTQAAAPTKSVRPETRRTLTPSRIPRRSHNAASPANSTASSTRMETRENDGEANPRRRLAGSMTPTSMSPRSRIMSSRLPPSRASSSGTLTPSSRSAATSPRGMSPLRGRGASSSQQQPRRPASLGAGRSLSNDRKPIKLPRVADLLNARNRDRASASPGSRLPRGSTFSGVPPVGLAGSPGQLGAARRMGTSSSPVTPNNRPKASPQGMNDMAPLHGPLRRTLSFNNNRRATLSPSNIRGAAASSKLQEMRGPPGGGGARRATLSETRRPPRQRVTIPEPFHLTGAELQAKALKQMEEQRRKREEMERRRRVFRARPMPDFSNPSPKPYL